jgi:hypothetical protein
VYQFWFKLLPLPLLPSYNKDQVNKASFRSRFHPY